MLIARRAALSAVLKSVPFDISKDEFPDGISLSITFDPGDLEENDG